MKHIAKALLPTQFGAFTVHAFVDGKGKEHLALVKCVHPKHTAVPVRVHSKCLTGDTLMSKRCDCRDQLEAAIKYIAKKKCGILIYLDQEGRGIGLANKISAYALQDQGMDTVEANIKLGFKDDMRDFSIAAKILEYFQIKEISLLTNNPNKIAVLEENGIKVVERIPLIMKTNKYNEKYIKTKKEKLGHQF